MSTAHFTEVLFVGFFGAAGLYSALIFLITRDRLFLAYTGLAAAMAGLLLVFIPGLVMISEVDESLRWIYRLGAVAAFALAEGAVGFTLMQGDHRGTLPSRLYIVGTGGLFAGALAAAIVHYFQVTVVPQYLLEASMMWQALALAGAFAGHYARTETTRQVVPSSPASQMHSEAFKAEHLTTDQARKIFEARLHEAWETSVQQRAGLAVIAIAVGGLKEYNATHGRVAGDGLLRNVLQLCYENSSQPVDWFLIWDEAFAAIVPNVTRAEADKIGFDLRERVAKNCNLTIGVGVSSVENAISAEALIQQAARRSARDTISRETVPSIGDRRRLSELA